MKIRLLLVSVLLFGCAAGAFGSSPAFWELSNYTEFLKGKFDHVALSRSGTLSVAPPLETLFTTGQAYLWSMARAEDGTIYAGTGNQGRLYRIDRTGAGKVIWTAPQPEIFAVAAAPGGIVYAGTSPNGKIYRIENGRAQEYFNPKCTYIWSLTLGRDGALYAGTGTEGRIFRISAPGTGEEYFATGQTNVTGLQQARDGSLLAGTEPNGVLYRITSKSKAFGLYDSNLPEIRAMAEGSDGSIYAAGLGGAIAKKAQSVTQGGVVPGTDSPAVTTSITVTAEAAAAGEIKPADPPKSPPVPTVAAPATATTAATPIDLTGVERSAIYQIHTDNTVETLWSSKEENVYDILMSHEGLLFATDLGHIYRLDGERKITLVVQTGEGDLSRLFLDGSSVLAAAGTGGRIYRLADRPSAGGGRYESPVFDAGGTARWGHLERIGRGDINLLTRSGNSLRPDRTWSDWLPLAPGSSIASPNARFLSWKAELSLNAALENVTVGYLPQNTSPAVRSITALTTLQPATNSARALNGSSAATSSYSITVTDTGDAGPSTSTGTAAQTLSRAASQQLVLTWQADDPDGDKLVFQVDFRGEGDLIWKTLRRNFHENTLALDADSIPDGRYFFRVTASDREVNAGSLAREADLVSSAILIDNTPPLIAIGKITGHRFEWTAVDSASALKRADYSVDGGVWVPLNPVEGILDSKHARFHVNLSDLTPGEHIVVVRAVDQANNSGQAKVVLP